MEGTYWNIIIVLLISYEKYVFDFVFFFFRFRIFKTATVLQEPVCKRRHEGVVVVVVVCDSVLAVMLGGDD